MGKILELFTDESILSIIKLSLQVSGTALLIGASIGIILGTSLGIYNFKGKKLALSIVYTLMGLPPVLIGVLVYLLLSNSGPLGVLELLFTPTAMVIAQVILVMPIVTGLTYSAVASNERKYSNTAITLGASKLQLWGVLLKESKTGIITAILTAFGRALSEVGAVMLVGGNIEGYTRVMTTSMVLETRQGNFDVALALGAVLLAISFTINLFILWRFMFRNASKVEVIL